MKIKELLFNIRYKIHHTVSNTLQESVKCQMNVNYLAWQRRCLRLNTSKASNKIVVKKTNSRCG